jgi:hypothetical protein
MQAPKHRSYGISEGSAFSVVKPVGFNSLFARDLERNSAQSSVQADFRQCGSCFLIEGTGDYELVDTAKVIRAAGGVKVW